MPAAAAPSSFEPGTLRYAFAIAETGFDPAQFADLYSRTVAAALFEAPLEYAYLAAPARLRPATAAAMPEVSADHRSFTFRIKPGIFFADDAAFGGRARELTAADYVYSLKRHYDPRWNSANLYILEAAGVLGMARLREEALARKTPLDYEREVAGLQVLDRYTFRVRVAQPSPRLLYHFADPSFTGAVAREVVQRYGAAVGEHPVGTGAFRLARWQRGFEIVLERNPGYREARYDETPPAGDARLQAEAARLKGRRLPLLERVRIAVIPEAQPRWLSFLNAEHDLIEHLPAEFAPAVVVHGKLAPGLARRGLVMQRYARPSVALSYFAMDHPVVGGYAPQQVALRRAIALAVDLEREVRLVRRGQAVPAQSVVAPQVYGHDPAFKSEMSEHSLPRAKALLDLYGWIDRDGDGWRDRPDGTPLMIEYATQPDAQSRQLAEQWKRNMDALGVRIVFNTATWPENLKRSRTGRLMMWGMGWLAGHPDGDTFLALAYGPNKGQANHARFDLPAFNQLYERQRTLPDGPERAAAIDAAKRLLVAYMPIKAHVHHVSTDLVQPWVRGYHRNVYVLDFWKYLAVEGNDADLLQPGTSRP